MKIELCELHGITKSKIGWVFCSSSFEDRWYSLAFSLGADIVESVCVIERSCSSKAVFDGLSCLEGKYSSSMQRVYIDDYSPISFLRVALTEIIERIELSSLPSIVDITTFSHEAVLIILRLVHERGLQDKVIFSYTQAEDYSTNTDRDELWLSNGVKDIRSVVGFPGNFFPTKKSHLILLVGFEVDRARHLIEEYEPACISLGLGSQSFRPEFFETNKKNYEKVVDFVGAISGSYNRVNEFEFSCSDPEATKSKILSLVDSLPDYNHTLCPMNTKMSTLGAGMAALKDDAIKMCYVEPIEYNVDGYSSPGDKATFFSMGKNIISSVLS